MAAVALPTLPPHSTPGSTSPFSSHNINILASAMDPSLRPGRSPTISSISSITSTGTSRTTRALPTVPGGDQLALSTAAASSGSSRRTAARRPSASPGPSSKPAIPRAVSRTMRPSRDGFVKFTSSPRSLAGLLSFLPWTDFVSLTQTCRAMHGVMDKHDLRDVILTKYVEGYGIVLRMQNARDATKEVPVTLHDLDLLLISQHTPLHTYPTQALVTISTAKPDTARAQKLARLAQAHSRFVLLLQSLAHSSSLPPPPEPEPEVDPIIEDSSATGSQPGLQFSLPATRSTITGRSQSAMRELTFPAPLCKPQPTTPRDEPPPVPSKHYRHSTSPGPRPSAKHVVHGSVSSQNAPSAFTNTRHTARTSQSNGVSRSVTARSPSKTLTSSQSRRRLSIFGNGAAAPPPPPSEPKDLTHYSTGWRRSLINASISHHAKRAASAHVGSTSEAWASDDDELGFRRPHRRFASGNFNSSESSVSSAHGSSGFNSAGTSSPPFAQSERRSSPSPPPPALSATASPHDLILATSRVRAPILRVYVPCSDLSEGPEASFLDSDYFYASGGASSIQQCEEQLVDSGLWDHMSIGDVVCNLGYVPPAGSADDSTGEDSPPGLHQELTRGRTRLESSTKAKEKRTWLIFNGTYLIPFSPTVDALPIADAISLPSPFYYDHILSSGPTRGVRGGNLQIALRHLPPPASGTREEPQMQLVSHVTSVRSPHTRGGYATVRKWSWTARAWRGGMVQSLSESVGAGDGAVVGPAAAMGVGWEGEWVLEGDGTSEGRQFLLDCLHGAVKTPRKWEFVREKSGGSRIWLKLLDSRVSTNQPTALPHSHSLLNSPTPTART